MLNDPIVAVGKISAPGTIACHQIRRRLGLLFYAGVTAASITQLFAGCHSLQDAQAFRKPL
jgi:hypothetical protein